MRIRELRMMPSSPNEALAAGMVRPVNRGVARHAGPGVDAQVRVDQTGVINRARVPRRDVAALAQHRRPGDGRRGCRPRLLRRGGLWVGKFRRRCGIYSRRRTVRAESSASDPAAEGHDPDEKTPNNQPIGSFCECVEASQSSEATTGTCIGKICAASGRVHQGAVHFAFLEFCAAWSSRGQPCPPSRDSCPEEGA